MSKKRKNKPSGTITLKPTKAGKKLLYSRSLLPQLGTLENMLDDKLSRIKDGDWDGADLTVDQYDLIECFIGYLSEMPDEISADPGMIEIAGKILQYGKAWYEYYPDADQNPIDDGLYDTALATYKRYGAIEPVGIVPAGAVKSSEIRNPNLHNNLDKCYRIYDVEPIPEGTAEKDSVEAWLSRCYDKLSLPRTERLQLMLAHKLDGVSVIADVGSDGRIIAAQSRGDEEKAMSMPGLIGLKVCSAVLGSTFKKCTIQYEMFCTNDQRIIAPGITGADREYKSNRSAAAAIRKRLESGPIDNVECAISLYPIIGEGEGSDAFPKDCYSEIIDYVQNFARVPDGMHLPTFISGCFDDLLSKIYDYFDALKELRADLEYPIDGMVITVASLPAQSVIGRSGRTNLFQIAMKFNPSFGDAEVDDVYLSSGNKGFRTVMVKLKTPVFIDGAEYPEVQVLSIGQYNELKLDVGCAVRVHRTGDVIPKLTKLKDGNGTPIVVPDICPACGSKLVIEARKYKCVNPRCPENVAGRIRSFFNVVMIEGYSDAFAKRLIAAGIDSPLKIMKLTKKELKKAGITGKREDEFVDTVQRLVRGSKDHRLLASLSLPGIGPITAKKLVEELGLHYLTSTELSTLEMAIRAIPGFNEKATTIALTLLQYRSEIQELESLIDPDDLTKPGVKRITVGHTGTAITPKVKYWIDKMGYDVTDGAVCDLLLVADLASTSRKVERAKKHNVPFFNEQGILDELMKRYYYKVAAQIAAKRNVTTKAVVKI